MILATGAIERPLVFPGNDRPGIMLAGAARAYLNRFAVLPGRQVLIVTADDSAYRVAIDLHAAGVAVVAVADQRAHPSGEAIEAVRALGVPIHTDATITRTGGRLRVHSARLSNGTVVACDTILMSGGWTPSVQLCAQSRRPIRFDPESGSFLPKICRIPSGPAPGAIDLAEILARAVEAGGSAPRRFEVIGLPVMAPSARARPTAPHRKAFVDFQNDVTTS